jgi:hypothetical protein
MARSALSSSWSFIVAPAVGPDVRARHEAASAPSGAGLRGRGGNIEEGADVLDLEVQEVGQREDDDVIGLELAEHLLDLDAAMDLGRPIGVPKEAATEISAVRPPSAPRSRLRQTFTTMRSNQTSDFVRSLREDQFCQARTIAS